MIVEKMIAPNDIPSKLCSDGAYLFENQCQNCPQNCHTCKNGTSCDKCSEGTFFNKKNNICILPNPEHPEDSGLNSGTEVPNEIKIDVKDQNKNATDIDSVVTEAKDPGEETNPEVDSFEEWEEVSKNITTVNDTKVNETDVKILPISLVDDI